MKRFAFLHFCVFTLCLVLHAQQFTLMVDTIKVDTTDMMCEGKFGLRLAYIAKRNDKIYCLYKNTIQGMVGNCAYKHLLSIDGLGQISGFPLPDDIKEDMSVGEGLFVRNDSLILRRFHSYRYAMFHVAWEKEHDYTDEEIGKTCDYYWDSKSTRWVDIPFADDHIYEDKDYKISLWSCGEWGTYVRFLSKKTHKDYIYRCKYVIKNEQKNGMTMIGSFTDVPIRVFKQTDGYYLITPKSMIRISDPSEGRKVMDIDCNYTPYVHQSYMRDCDSPKDHTLLLLTDRKAGKDAILTVEGLKIHIRYLIYC